MSRARKASAVLVAGLVFGLVVGLALATDGSEQYASQHCRRFARQLEGRYALPVVLVDERGSSVEAQKITGNAPDDAVAAAIILQRYFDTHL